jgi:predicted transcriptional regulator
MNLKEVIEATEAEMLVEPAFTIDLEAACASDLMSDVLVFTKPNMLLVTGLTNPQAIRTADMAEAPAVLFVRGKYPPPETLALAEKMGIAVMLSPYTMFETAGLLFKAGLKGIGKLPILRQSR